MSTFTGTKGKGSSSPRSVPDERVDDKRGVALAVPTPSPEVKEEVVEWEPRQANNEGEARAVGGSVEEPLTPEAKVKLEDVPEGNRGKRERDGGGVSDADGGAMKRYALFSALLFFPPFFPSLVCFFLLCLRSKD